MYQCVCVCVCVCACDHSWARGSGLVEKVVVNRASVLTGLLTVDLSASLEGMCALGTRAHISAPGAPNYPAPCVYVKACQGSSLHLGVMSVVCLHVLYVTPYINATVQYQGHPHHHSLSHTHCLVRAHTPLMPPVEGDSGQQ